MSIQEIERRRRQRLASLSSAPPFQILTFNEWCAVNGISPRTGRRIISGPDGPVVTQLSAKRIGISIANHLAWLKSRERA
jgi:hypothetical protein